MALFSGLSEKLNQFEEKDIFKKEKTTNFTKDELEILMAQLEEKWT